MLDTHRNSMTVTVLRYDSGASETFIPALLQHRKEIRAPESFFKNRKEIRAPERIIIRGKPT